MHLNRASDHSTGKRLKFLPFVLFALFVVIHSFLEQLQSKTLPSQEV